MKRRCRGEEGRPPGARTIAQPLTVECDRLSKAETVMVAAIEDSVPPPVEAREIIAAS
jgi:hypothetical protein